MKGKLKDVHTAFGVSQTFTLIPKYLSDIFWSCDFRILLYLDAYTVFTFHNVAGLQNPELDCVSTVYFFNAYGALKGHVFCKMGKIYI